MLYNVQKKYLKDLKMQFVLTRHYSAEHYLTNMIARYSPNINEHLISGLKTIDSSLELNIVSTMKKKETKSFFSENT